MNLIIIKKIIRESETKEFIYLFFILYKYIFEIELLKNFIVTNYFRQFA